MRWEDGRQSGNVEDRRGMRMPGGRAGGLGLGTIVVALLGSWLFGINPMVTIGLMQGAGQLAGGGAPTQVEGRRGPVQDEAGRFTSVVLASTEDVWTEIFRQAGAQYRAPKLVMFEGATPTACGTGQTATGPFYCPLDQSVYIDLSFYRMLAQKFQAPGEFANAYVVAHEVGHHIQNLLGTMKQVQGAQQRAGERQANLLSVRLELQADCYAGVWAHHSQKARNWLDRTDIEAGLNAASQIGDDKMMKRSQGVVVPDAFTHGSGQQRVHWFGVGMRTGRLDACDTFRQTSP
ncbi:MAG: zinc metallopeptidase [Burkholderiaceae bacterium]|jgi:predicted metalloprotease|nr:neutral zinc metallopeptidase [Burkholderiales bacterium]MCZ8098916.1 zinc metallopeptidase [Burkholderiales bacterium]MCZ8339158.1 zinc metallopeptidase [Burkholderiaceae bacterium]